MFQQTNSSLLPASNMMPNSYQPFGAQEDRVGFLGPFLLGGITGGLVAPFFYGNNSGYNQPYYTNNYYYPPMPAPYYGPYYY